MLNARIRNTAVLPRARRARRSTGPARPKRANGRALTAAQKAMTKKRDSHALTFPSVANDSCFLRTDWKLTDWRTAALLTDQEWSNLFDDHMRKQAQERLEREALERQIIAEIESALKKNNMKLLKSKPKK